MRKLPNGWRSLSKTEDRACYRTLMQSLSFGVGSTDGSKTIIEPNTSETYLLKNEISERQLCNDYILFFKSVTLEDDYIYIFDHHHTSYKFWPHKLSKIKTEADLDWPMNAEPDGDYVTYFSSNFKSAIYYHPWETRTACVIGLRYIDAMKMNRPRAFGRKIRRGGKPIE